MRFITEFELNVPYDAQVRNAYIGRGKLDIGHLISESFGWEKKAFKNMQGDDAKRWTLEIEAFPMDKWLEFKSRLSAALPDYDSVSRTRIINAMADLESFTGK